MPLFQLPHPARPTDEEAPGAGRRAAHEPIAVDGASPPSSPQ